MEYSNEAIVFVWGVTLVVGAVVIIVVAILLNLIKNTAKKIDAAAGTIWTEGKLVANNTIHIPLFLGTTNKAAGEILKTAVNILEGAKTVETHIKGCPGCPQCVLS